MDNAKLKTLVSLEPYASMTPEAAAAALNATTVTVVYERFVNYRTLMAELTPDEYRAVRATFKAAAESDPLLADADAAMHPAAGGIDFGHANTRTLIDALFTADLAAKLKGLAERKVTPASNAGITETVWPADIRTVRS